MHLATVLPPWTNARMCPRTVPCCFFLFFFLTFLHKPVPQDSASSRILCPCITSCDDLASSVQRDYEVHRETREDWKKKVWKDWLQAACVFVLCCTCEKLTRCASFKSWDVGFPELVMWFRVEREQRSWHLQTIFFNHYFSFDPHPTLTLFWSWSILWQCLLGVCWLLAEKKGKKKETVDNVASAAVTVSDYCCSWQCCFFFLLLSLLPTVNENMSIAFLVPLLMQMHICYTYLIMFVREAGWW